MKTSDKLLLTLALAILAVFGGVQLTLYARMKAGYVNTPTSRDGFTQIYTGDAPVRLTVRGNVNLTLIPSDSFAVYLQDESTIKVSCQRAGDSLLVNADSLLTINPHTSFQIYGDLPWVSIHIPSGVHSIRLEGQLALLRGGSKEGDFRCSLQAVNSQLWLGESDGAGSSTSPAYFYDSVHVETLNGNLVVHPNAAIKHISVQLDGQSEINDLNGVMGTFDLEYSPLAKVNLKGSTLDKLRK